MKTKLLIETVVAGETISKEKPQKKLKVLGSKTESIQNQFKETHVTLIEDEADADRYTKKSKDKALKSPQ
jgi:hypothetical protein